MHQSQELPCTTRLQHAPNSMKSFCYGALLGVFFVLLTVFCMPILLMIIVDFSPIPPEFFLFDTLINTLFRFIILAMIMPAIFCVALMEQYSLMLRWKRMWEMTAFSFIFLSFLVFVFLVFIVLKEDSAEAHMSFLLVFSPMVLCLLVYVSTSICLAYDDLPLPMQDNILEAASNDNTLDASCDRSEDINEIWARHMQRCPKVVRQGLSIGYMSTVLLAMGVFLPLFGLPEVHYVSGMFLWCIFLLSFILYNINKRPYAFWRYAYIIVFTIFFTTNLRFEISFGQIILYLCLVGHLTAVLSFFRRDARQWFV